MKIGNILFLLPFIFFISLPFRTEASDKDIELSITKGVYLIDSGLPEEAIEILKKALDLAPSNIRLLQTLGIACSRAGRFSEAMEYLSQVLKAEPENCRAAYEFGAVLLELGRTEEGEQYFRMVAERCPDETLKEAAYSYIEGLTRSRAEAEKKLYLNFITGIQYDSNVILEPEEPFIKRPEKADWRSVLFIDAGINLLQNNDLNIRAGYMFYQSIHKSLNDFNIHQHSASLRLAREFNNRFMASLLYNLQYSLVGGELYSVVNTVSPEIEIPTFSNMTTSIFYKHEFRRFFDSRTFPVNSLRSGDLDATGISEKIEFMKESDLVIGYSIENDRTETEYLDSLTHRISALFKKRIESWHLYLRVEYLYRVYKETEPGFSEKRKEGRQEYSLNIVKDLSRYFSIYGSEIYISNNANISSYDYSRNITGLFLVVKL